jgi:hypothetical protein
VADITSWPYPRILQTEYNTFYLYTIGTNLYLALLHYTTAAYFAIRPQMMLGITTDIDDVSIADFGYFFVVGIIGPTTRRTLYRRYTEAITSPPEELVEPVVGTVLNHKGQFLGGNVVERPAGNWKDIGKNAIIWGAIGDFVLDPETNIGAGYKNLTLGGGFERKQTVHKLMTLGNSVLVYTNSGNCILKPAFVSDIFTYGEESTHGEGVISSLHVAGSNLIQGYIDRNKEFWIIDAGLQSTKLGYREQITDILAYTHSTNDYRTIVNYLPRNRTFYICNGNTCLAINSYGAYFIHQMISSIALSYDGINYGTFLDNLDLEARIESDTLDFGVRGLKSIESIWADISCSQETAVQMSVDYRYSKSSSFVSSRWVHSGLNGESRIGVTAVEFRLKIRFSNYTNSELSGLMPNIKFSDRRFSRGTTPSRGITNAPITASA